MAQVHMTEAELARDLHAVHRSVMPARQRISEVLALMPKDSTATMDADFAHDVEAAIESHREPLDPPKWD